MNGLAAYGGGVAGGTLGGLFGPLGPVLGQAAGWLYGAAEDSGSGGIREYGPPTPGALEAIFDAATEVAGAAKDATVDVLGGIGDSAKAAPVIVPVVAIGLGAVVVGGAMLYFWPARPRGRR